MTIKKSALNEFLNATLENYDWIKEVSDKDLEHILNTEFDPVPKFHTVPFLHQKACFIIGWFVPEFLYLLDLGTGKTKIILDLLRYRKQCEESFEALVLVPNVGNIEGWVEEIEIHAPDLDFVEVYGDRSEKEDLLKHKSDLFILNYQSLVRLISSPDVKAIEKGHGAKLKIDEKLIRPLKRKFDILILDESTAVMNQSSLTFRGCNRIAKEAISTFALTGTPFGRDPVALWSQFKIVDKGETLGSTLGLFREAFMENVDNYWTDYKYELKDKRKKKLLHERLKNRSIYYNENECSSLPKRVYIKKKVSFPDDAHKYYIKVIEELRHYKGDIIKTKNCFVRLRQITSGYLTYVDEKNKVHLKFPDNPKLDKLDEILDELPPNSKAIIVHEFIYTGHMITELLKKKKIKHVALWSGTKDKRGTIRKFKRDKSVIIMVMNHRSGAFGLNLQAANYIILFESPVSPIRRRQTEKRIHRQGQKKKRCFYIDILLKNSVDDTIIKYLKEGKSLFRELIKGKIKLS